MDTLINFIFSFKLLAKIGDVTILCNRDMTFPNQETLTFLHLWGMVCSKPFKRVAYQIF